MKPELPPNEITGLPKLHLKQLQLLQNTFINVRSLY